MPESEQTGFNVVDKRGQRKEEPADSAVQGENTPAGKGPEGRHGVEDVNFVTFLFSLYSSAMAAFGKIPDPETGKEQVHIEAGKQMIDILGILAEKTTGNLNDEESQLLENILYELRMIYLEKTNRIKI